MKRGREIRCVVLDFDGTIADTLRLTMRILNKLAPVYNYRRILPRDVDAVRQMTTRQLIRHMNVSHLRLPQIIAESKRLLGLRVGRAQTYDGMVDTLKLLRERVRVLGVLTSNSTANVSAFLATHKIEFFDFISTIPQLSGKAKNLRAILRTFSLQPQELLYVGDELRDRKAAEKAGIPFAAVTWGFNSPSVLAGSRPEYMLHRPEDLLALCEPHRPAAHRAHHR